MIDLRLLQKLFALIFNFDDLKNDIIAKVTSVFLNMFAGNDFSFPLMCKSRSTQDDSVVFVIILVFSFDIFVSLVAQASMLRMKRLPKLL